MKKLGLSVAVIASFALAGCPGDNNTSVAITPAAAPATATIAAARGMSWPASLRG